MEIFTLLETLEDLLERGRNVPFSAKIIVDKEEMLDLIKEIRLKLPDELKQAKWVKEERQRILAESQKEADGIVKEAENRIIAMIDEHEITRKAYEKINGLYDKGILGSGDSIIAMSLINKCNSINNVNFLFQYF